MLFLAAALLSFWPAPVLEFGPSKPVESGNWVMTVNECCGSMRPHLKGGERIHVSLPTPGERLIGKVISNGAVLHMVIAENPRAVRTSGTNCRSDPEWTPRSNIQYVVRYVVDGSR